MHNMFTALFYCVWTERLMVPQTYFHDFVSSSNDDRRYLVHFQCYNLVRIFFALMSLRPVVDLSELFLFDEMVIPIYLHKHRKSTICSWPSVFFLSSRFNKPMYPHFQHYDNQQGFLLSFMSVCSTYFLDVGLYVDPLIWLTAVQSTRAANKTKQTIKLQELLKLQHALDNLEP